MSKDMYVVPKVLLSDCQICLSYLKPQLELLPVKDFQYGGFDLEL